MFAIVNELARGFAQGFCRALGARQVLLTEEGGVFVDPVLPVWERQWHSQKFIDATDGKMNNILTGQPYGRPSTAIIKEALTFFRRCIPQEEGIFVAAKAAKAAYNGGSTSMQAVQTFKKIETELAQASIRFEFLKNAISWCEKTLSLRFEAEQIANRAIVLLEEKILKGELRKGRNVIETTSITLEEIPPDVMGEVKEMIKEKMRNVKNVVSEYEVVEWGAPYEAKVPIMGTHGYTLRQMRDPMRKITKVRVHL